MGSVNSTEARTASFSREGEEMRGNGVQRPEVVVEEDDEDKIEVTLPPCC